jgi:hypothetical protein
MNSPFYEIEGFEQKFSKIGGEDCVLIFPDSMKTVFDDRNKIYRSSIWTLDGRPVSLGYRKFVNFGESPGFEPLDMNQKLRYEEKIDGSCLIVSVFNGDLVVRTRRTFSAAQLPNGHEIATLRLLYPKAFVNSMLYSEKYSFVYEWTTPSNVVVLRYGDIPQLWLTGIVRHDDYSYLPQARLDEIASEIEVKRGQSYNFNSFREMEEAVKTMEKKEGVVIYSEDGQILKKVKSLSYLKLHRIKSWMGSPKSLVSTFLEYNGDIDSCLDSLTDIDFETKQELRKDLTLVRSAYDSVNRTLLEMKEFIDKNVVALPSRKEQAAAIMSSCYDSGIMFGLLTGKTMPVNKMGDWIKERLSSLR